jgi:hypothetical protein
MQRFKSRAAPFLALLWLWSGSVGCPFRLIVRFSVRDAFHLGGYMRSTSLVALLALGIPACASNRGSDEPGARVHDTTLTARDTTNPNDTLPHIRDSMPDSTR